MTDSSFISKPKVEEERAAGAKGEGEGKRRAVRTSETKAETPPAAKVAPAKERGFGIDLSWLQDAIGKIKWSEETVKTYLASKYQVSPVGSLFDVISQLTRVQAEEFVRKIQDRVAQKQTELFD